MKKITYVTGNWAKVMSAKQILEPLGIEIDNVKMQTTEIQADSVEEVAMHSAKEAQFKLWEICPNPIYVANPNKGFSKHSRGNTVDITIVSLSGEKVEMPSGFDDFTKKADRDYSDVSKEAGENAKLLEKVMEEAGFEGYAGEWWHYSDEEEYPVV